MEDPLFLEIRSTDPARSLISFRWTALDAVSWVASGGDPCLLDAVDLEWNQEPTGAIQCVAVRRIESRVVIPELQSKPRFRGAVRRVGGIRVAEGSIPFSAGCARLAWRAL